VIDACKPVFFAVLDVACRVEDGMARLFYALSLLPIGVARMEKTESI
jgi:hypothetical protein